LAKPLNAAPFQTTSQNSAEQCHSSNLSHNSTPNPMNTSVKETNTTATVQNTTANATHQNSTHSTATAMNTTGATMTSVSRQSYSYAAQEEHYR
jgi:hypothetical protein